MSMNAESPGKLQEVNGANFYYELRGSGSPVLFIAGATGDAGHFERVAELLSDEFTVATYDRRGNSRSPRPEDWQSTSTQEQSDDVAGLIEALGVAPTTVFGNSSGAIIGLDLLIRYPQLVRGTILHEPPMTSYMSNPEEMLATLQQVIEGGMQRGGPRGGVEAFLRFAAGDKAFESLEPQLRERLLGNGETLFGIEMGVMEPYQPEQATLAAVEVPVRVMVGTESAPFFAEVAQWLADSFNVKLERLPGGHASYFDRPEEVAQTLRPLLRELSG